MRAKGRSNLTIYFDGVQSNSTPRATNLSLEVPCRTEVVAFKVDQSSTDGGLVASYSNGLWNTGDGSFVCTSNADLVGLDWKIAGKLTLQGARHILDKP